MSIDSRIQEMSTGVMSLKETSTGLGENTRDKEVGKTVAIEGNLIGKRALVGSKTLVISSALFTVLMAMLPTRVAG